MILVKLGGSVITDKDRLRNFRKASCARLCGELRPARDGLVLIHGAGSFGHIVAKKEKLNKGVPDGDLRKLRAVARVHGDVRDLNSKVLSCMSAKKLKGYSLPPHTVASFSNGSIAGFCPEKFEMLLDNDMIPVSFGDVVPDSRLKFSICSGDVLMLALAKHFKPELTVFVADVDGIFDKDPKKYRSAKLVSVVSPDNLGGISAGTRSNDVTKAMQGKLARMLEIAEYCENTIILNGNVAGRLERALKGKEVTSTKVVA